MDQLIKALGRLMLGPGGSLVLILPAEKIIGAKQKLQKLGLVELHMFSRRRNKFVLKSPARKALSVLYIKFQQQQALQI